MSRKALYETVNALEAKIKQQEAYINSIIYGSTTGGKGAAHKINSAIINSANYNMVLTAADIVQATNCIITDIPELKLPSNRLEMLWYTYGSLCFYNEGDGVKVASYTKTGRLNGLGDLTEIYPIDFSGKTYDKAKQVVYDDTAVFNPAVIINDYTGTYLEGNIIPRSMLNSVSIHDQSTVYHKMIAAVKLTAKKAIALIDNETQKDVVTKTISQFFEDDNPVAALVGKNLNEVVKMFNLDTKLDLEGYLRAIESYERLRANFNGIRTRSMLDKKERLITSEAENDNAITEVYLYDRLLNRQIGIELMKKHAIIKEGSAKINPKLLPPKQPEESSKNKSNKVENKEE